MTRILCISIVCVGALAQEGTRQLWNPEFLKQRPAAPTAAPPGKKISYRPVDGKAAPVSSSSLMMGITLWKLRDAKPSDAPATRLLVLEKNGAGRSSETVPERIEAGSPLAPGDRVRLTVEVPRPGYLYVINREQYADGSLSAAYLIYPNFQTTAGDNAVAAGRLIEIPDRRDEINCFTIRPTRADQTGEVLALLVTSEPLKDLAIGRNPLRLSEEQYAVWEKKWTVEAQRFELEDSAGKAWTEREKRAGADHRMSLTQNDAMPQTLYHVPAKPGVPILLNLKLPLRK